MATHVGLDAGILQCHRRLSSALFSVVGLVVMLTLGSCSSPVASSGAETAPTHTADSPGTGNTTDASETTALAGSAVTTYKPATAEGPAENVPLPVMPELAKQESKEGLEAYARYWYELVNYVLETGETSVISDISDSSCAVCSNVYDVVSDGYYEDDWIVGGKITPVGAYSEYAVTSTGSFQVLIQIKQEKTEYRGPGNVVYGVDDGFDADTVQMMEATYSDSHWHPHDVVTIKR